MKVSKKQAPLIYSGIGILSTAVVAAAVFAKRYFLRRKADNDADLSPENAGPSGIMEDLVRHNTKGF
ncbi:MAG: hypothetical protein WCP06_11735 [Verrucomicrobiota bacterium]